MRFSNKETNPESQNQPDLESSISLFGKVLRAEADAILQAAERSIESGKKLMARLKLNNPETDQTPILVAALSALGKIGSVKSTEFMTTFAKSRSPLAVDAQKALKAIEAREIKSSAA